MRRDRPRLTLRVILEADALPARSRLDAGALRRPARRAAAEHGVAGRVTVVLTDDETLHRLNRAFRGIDGPTDVLSFDMRDQAGDDLAGEVYISLPYARRKASKRGRSLQAEVLHLTVHGVLHLAGYDHETEDDWREMERETRKYLGALS